MDCGEIQHQKHRASFLQPPVVKQGAAVFSKDLLDEVMLRLQRGGFCVMATPFGYFNEFTINVAGDSLAKVFKEF